MAIQLKGFSAGYAGVVRRSLAVIRRRLAGPPAPIPHDLRAGLRAILDGPRPRVALVYGGDRGVCAVPYARSAGYLIVLCRRTFDHARLPAVLLHELIHVARGWELDAEAFENALFAPREGARRPTAEDWTTFRAHDYQGWWVRMNPRTRLVTDYADRPIVTFPLPARSRRRSGRASG